VTETFTLKAVGVHHVPTSGPAILVANYVSEADPELLQSAITRRIHFENLNERLLDGELIAIFPESAPARTGSIETFRPEVEALIAATPSAVVIPAAICSLGPNAVRVLLVGEPLKQKMTAPQLRRRIVELSCEGIQHSQTNESTLIHRFVEIARKKWNDPAISDSSQKRLSFGELLTESLLLSQWLRSNTGVHEQNIGDCELRRYPCSENRGESELCCRRTDCQTRRGTMQSQNDSDLENVPGACRTFAVAGDGVLGRRLHPAHKRRQRDGAGARA
jgi:hypothetical protein